VTNDEKANLEFEIAFAETNLRYLAGEPDSIEKTVAVKVNTEAIARCKARLEQLKGKEK
jgi:hypothetical protein